MAYITFEHIDQYYGSQHVLKDLNLSVEKGAFVTLLGPSGCGKSTLLRCLAGLEPVSHGRILLDGEDITHKAPRVRHVGMIFQQYSLFPTMTVAGNIAFGLKIQGVCRSEIAERVREVLEIVDLKGSEKKYPSQLSGGEQQRVALCRSLVTKPKVLLMDEPFSAIDAKLRKELQTRIKEIHEQLGMTTLFVTHDNVRHHPLDAQRYNRTVGLTYGAIRTAQNTFCRQLYGQLQHFVCPRVLTADRGTCRIGLSLYSAGANYHVWGPSVSRRR